MLVYVLACVRVCVFVFAYRCECAHLLCTSISMPVCYSSKSPTSNSPGRLPVWAEPSCIIACKPAYIRECVRACVCAYVCTDNIYICVCACVSRHQKTNKIGLTPLKHRKARHQWKALSYAKVCTLLQYDSCMLDENIEAVVAALAL